MNNEKLPPLFETSASKTLEEALKTLHGRGGEYGDNYRDCQYLTLKALCRKFGINVPEQYLTIISLAVLCDIKFSRQIGGYKEDTLVDLINYMACLVEEVKKLEPKS